MACLAITHVEHLPISGWAVIDDWVCCCPCSCSCCSIHNDINKSEIYTFFPDLEFFINIKSLADCSNREPLVFLDIFVFRI